MRWRWGVMAGGWEHWGFSGKPGHYWFFGFRRWAHQPETRND